VECSIFRDEADMTVAVAWVKTPQAARASLHRRFREKLITNEKLDRTLVSFQANRRLPYYRWLKYKEGFSAQFIEYVINELALSPGVLLDPFAGTGAALFAARKMGWDTIGIELLPVGFLAIEARLAAEMANPQSLQRQISKAKEIRWEDLYSPEWRLQHVPITRGAFSEATERAIAGYRAYCSRVKNVHLRTLFELAGLATLESVSYTRKDGQYLRWDYRAEKDRVTARFDKGPILDFDSAVGEKLSQICDDVLGRNPKPTDLFETKHQRAGYLDLRHGSCLDILPGLEDRSVDLVITSPPYCNRYDYTRTYALELVYLGADGGDIKTLRQSLLSCTVENRTKLDQLEALYTSHNGENVFAHVTRIFERQAALQEVLGILETYGAAGKLNNANIPNMVRNYFLEMAFVVRELARILRPGGSVVMVNDNVRYAGEEVPVDLILSDFAQSFGLETQRIWTLARGKGNSSQQMGEHGRSELRKCVYVWRKNSGSPRIAGIG
jgi:DNA modification methylase